MQTAKALAAILAAFFLGGLVLMFVGCRPTGQMARPSSSLTTEPSAPVASEPASSEPAVAITEEKPVEAEKAPETASTETATEKPAESATAEEKKPTEEAPAANATAESKPAAEAASTDIAADVFTVKPGDWNQWGGTPLKNNTPVAENIPTEWNTGKFDRRTGKWNPSTAQNIKWFANLGSQTYGNTVVASGKVLLGTNNSGGYLKRYPADVDLGVLICFDEKDGKFLWQHSSEKLPTGRVHDWPLMGICCSPLVEGERLWFVTSRGEVKCLDVEGFHDDQDDGPVKNEPARLFDIARADDPAEDKVGGYVTELDGGKLPEELRENFTKAGMELPAGEIAVKVDDKAKAPSKKWTFKAKVGDAERDFYFLLAGPRLSAFKVVTPADKEEADVIWSFDMMRQLGVSQHNMCSCSVTAVGDILFVNTSNGVDEAHIVVPAPDAPSFIAMDKNTGKVFWTDNSPGRNILHGQWSSPAVAVIDGVPQVIFGGGDGWMYGFKADKGKDGKPELLWKFDANPKDSVLILGGRGTRNDIIATPVVYDNKVYFATGQDPEHGEGSGILWCIDPTKRGDISEQLAVKRDAPDKPIPVKRVQAVVESEGDIAVPNPNSGVVWKYATNDANGDKKIDFEEQFHRAISTAAIKDDLLFVPDFSGLFHCVDAQTGKVHWTYDMLAAAWGSPMIVGDKVYVGDEDGDIAIFNLSAEKQDPLAEISMGNAVYSSPIIANGVLYIANKDRVFAIAEGAEPKATGGKEEKAASGE